ncbi:HAMP domain-containing sensor histidine kinase [Paenibacillus filicis]|uniref:histidine kinase n=1 Tax=Paenibacillus filicis TaxID=669464 RepID=A0ABU9DT83_9BACL
MSLIAHLLLQILLAIMPILLYQLFWTGRNHLLQERRYDGFAAILTALSAILSMTYPIAIPSGLPCDLRLLSVAACLMYAGLLPAAAVAAITLIYQFVLDSGALFYLSVISTLLAMAYLLLIRRKTNANGRVLHPLTAAAMGLTLSLLTASAAIIYQTRSGYGIDMKTAGFYTVYALAYVGAAVLAAYAARQSLRQMSMLKQAEHHDKMNVLTELAASFAHEVRHPMTVAKGFVQMIKQGDVSEGRRQVYVQMVLEEIERAQALIQDYLSFAKPQMDAIELLDAKHLVLQAIGSVETFARLRNVKIDADLQDKLMISANSDKFMQCIVHLCKNGIESMPGGGTLRVVGSLQSTTVSIDIIDHGIGMTPDEVGRLGTPYYSIRGKDAGLGMMVTYRAIQNIHGRIDVTSERGKGTCFTLLLPTLQPSSYH